MKGTKETKGKLPYELDFQFIDEMAKRMAANKHKYGPYNWRKPMEDPDQIKHAMMRHLSSIMQGEYEDDGHAYGHITAIACNAMILRAQLIQAGQKEILATVKDKDSEIRSSAQRERWKSVDHPENYGTVGLPEEVVNPMKGDIYYLVRKGPGGRRIALLPKGNLEAIVSATLLRKSLSDDEIITPGGNTLSGLAVLYEKDWLQEELRGIYKAAASKELRESHILRSPRTGEVYFEEGELVW